MDNTKQLANSSVRLLEMDDQQQSLDQFANTTPGLENERLHSNENSVSLKLSQITKEDEIQSPEYLAEQINSSFCNMNTNTKEVNSPLSVIEGENVKTTTGQYHLNTQRFPIRLNDRKSSNDVYKNKPKTTPKTTRTKISLSKPHVVPTSIDSENVEQFIKKLSQENNQQHSVFDQKSVMDTVRTSLDQNMKKETEEK